MPKSASQNSSPTSSKDTGESANLLGDEDHLMVDLNSPVHTTSGKVSQHHFNLSQMLSARLGFVQGAEHEIINVKRGLVDKTNVEPPTENKTATVNTSCSFSFNALKPQLTDITNSDDLTGGVKNWKRLAHEEGNNNNNTVEMADQGC